MKKLFYIIFPLMLMGMDACFGQAKIQYGNTCDLNANERYYLLLLAGQSNMVGQGKPGDLEGPSTFKNIFYFNYGMSPNLKIQEGTFGPEVGLSQVLTANFPGKKFLLIKYAVGGASLLDWSPDYDREAAKITGHPEFGTLYDSLQTRVAVITEGLDVRPAGLIWMQGERDARIPAAGKEYYQNFRFFIESLREDLSTPGLPIVFGKINPPKDLYPALDTVVKAQEKISEEISGTYLINTDHLAKWSDKVHYSSDGQVKLGRAFGETMVELLKENRKAYEKY